MHTVSLNMVKPSPNPVRKTWDEDKMEELAASIKERGVIVPIKVRPANEAATALAKWDSVARPLTKDAVDLAPEMQQARASAEYEIVYGHRRTEAARRAGLVEIPAIIEEPDDTDALIQALIENIQREDMNPVDVARGLKRLMDATGATIADISRLRLVSEGYASSLLALLDETDEVLSMVQRGVRGRTAHNKSAFQEQPVITERQVRAVRGSGIEQPQERERILKQAAETRLTAEETRAVADAYKQADTPELKDAVLKTSGKLGDADAILRTAKIRIGVDPISRYQEEDKRQAFEDYDQAVKDFLDAMKLFDRMLKTAKQAAKFGKFSPEGASFAARRIDALIDELEQLKGELSHE